MGKYQVCNDGVKKLGGHDPQELKAVANLYSFLSSTYLVHLRMFFGVLRLEPWQSDL